MHEWYEQLPASCPPENSINPDRKLYRLCACNPPEDSDFLSHRKLFPTKPFNTTECIARAVSVWEKKEICLDLTKLPRHKTKVVAELDLDSSDGLICKTGKPHHYSWWRSNTFQISNCKVI